MDAHSEKSNAPTTGTGGAQQPEPPLTQAGAPQQGPLPSQQGVAPAPDAQDEGGIGSFITGGVSAVREMNAAKRAHHEAREELEDLLDLIDDREQELDHRRDVEANYAQIISEQTGEKNAALAAEQDAQASARREKDRLEDLERTLAKTKRADEKVEQALRSAYDQAADAEDMARKALERAEKRTRDAKNALEAATKSRDADTVAAQKRIDDASMRMSKLESELAELGRSPSANPAEYSVRSRELMGKINETGAVLAEAQEAFPGIVEHATAAVADAQRELAEAEQPIARLEAAYQAARDAADQAHDKLASAQDDAEKRQKSLKDQIDACKKELRAYEQGAADAQRRLETAEQLIAEANDIHAHPEIAESLARQLELDYSERAQREASVSALAENERGVRKRTRGKRLSFIAAVAALVVVVGLVIAAIMILGGGR